MPFEAVVYGPGRSPLVGALLDALGTERTAVVVYLLQRAWDGLVVVTALAPALVWLLGATSVHAAARASGLRARFAPFLAAFGIATAATRIPADLVAMTVPPLAGLAGSIATVALAWAAWRLVRTHYGAAPQRAAVVLAVAVVLFYLIPLAAIVAAVIAILVAAIVLDYVPPL